MGFVASSVRGWLWCEGHHSSMYIVSHWRTGNRGNVSTLSSVLSSPMKYAVDDGLDTHFAVTVNESDLSF